MRDLSVIVLFLILLPLFSGSVLAGMMQAPQTTIGALWVLFVLAQILGGALRGKRGLRAGLTLVSLAAVQLGFVGLTYAIGWVIGQQSALPPLPPVLPIGLSLIGVVGFAVAAKRSE